ncbi:uncharacterized protein LOC121965689, partial [Plectropomus leopardus]|uniref:uncharacterized protein LOC121965689 n=1 Tax=Plectropomus leopardus TaxID=160734 RepID=UPI001C4CB200
VSPGLSQGPNAEPVSEFPSVSNSVLDAPEFPDFENSEMETSEGEAVVDIGALELEALDLVSTDPPVPEDCSVSDFEDPQPDFSECDPIEPLMSTCGVQDLNLGSQNIIPLDPDSFPEPINLSEFPEPAVSEQWSQSEEAIMDPLSSTQADETDLGAAESHSAAWETDNHSALYDELQQHCNVSQQDSYHEAYNNVYEDVEKVNKLILGQNSRKRKCGLK